MLIAKRGLRKRIMRSAYKEDFYPFFNEFQDAKSGEWALVTPQATKVTNTRSQVLMTLGFRF